MNTSQFLITASTLQTTKYNFFGIIEQIFTKNTSDIRKLGLSDKLLINLWMTEGSNAAIDCVVIFLHYEAVQ